MMEEINRAALLTANNTKDGLPLMDIDVQMATEIDAVRAVFAWERVEDGDLELLERYPINTLYINSTDFHTVPGYQCYLLAGDNRFTSSDIVAAIMALDRCIRNEGNRGGVYDERPIFVF